VLNAEAVVVVAPPKTEDDPGLPPKADVEVTVPKTDVAVVVVALPKTEVEPAPNNEVEEGALPNTDDDDGVVPPPKAEAVPPPNVEGDVEAVLPNREDDVVVVATVELDPNNGVVTAPPPNIEGVEPKGVVVTVAVDWLPKRGVAEPPANADVVDVVFCGVKLPNIEEVDADPPPNNGVAGLKASPCELACVVGDVLNADAVASGVVDVTSVSGLTSCLTPHRLTAGTWNNKKSVLALNHQDLSTAYIS
jgi:hypothetical protein